MSEISTSLSSYSIIDEVVQKSNGKFSFVDVLGSFINNREFSKGYLDYKDGINTNEAFIWQALSCIGNHVGNVVYSNVLGYIDNICNIDLCKVLALKSILSSFGLKYSIIDSIDTIPLEIQNVIDIMSINKKYLLSSGFLNDRLFNELSIAKYSIKNLSNIENIVSELELNKLSSAFNDISSSFTSSIAKNIRINETLDDSIYEKILSAIYKNIITSFIEMPYANKADYSDEFLSSISDDKFWPIYKTYGSIINDNEDKNSIVSESDELIYLLKVKNNLATFDEKTIVNNIYNGLDSLYNYAGTELEILKLEITNREEPKYKELATSKYAYYKEQKVYEYFDFIKNKFGNISVDYDLYEIDNNYFEFKNTKNITLLSSDENNIYSLKDNYYLLLDSVVNNLVYYTTAIAKLREKLKLLLLRNNMKGTFNLLSYVINEYLIEFSKSNIFSSIKDENINKTLNSLSSHILSDIEMIEYYDSTEYYNISTVNSNKSKYKNNVNILYWNSNYSDVNTENYAFKSNEIELFYLSTLNLKQTTNDLVKFLSTIYSAGANTSYIDDDGILHITSTNELSNDSIEIFKQFSGDRENGVIPYYNHKNKTHSSYLIHPYLYNFIETTNYNKIVDNGYYNDVVLQAEDHIVLEALSNNIGEYGLMINVALNNQYDFTGYRTLYEKSTHRSSTLYTNKIYEVVDYTGAFYPPAVEMFRNNKDSSIESLRKRSGEFYERFYEHLNLSDIDIDIIAKQLEEYYDWIVGITSTKYEEKDVWDIYKYGRDTYNNHYILYKKYDIPYGTTLTIKNKKDTTGELWIRLNNHPIAFPALAGNNPQITKELKYINGKFESDIAEKNNNVEDRYDKFYDMEFDVGKSILFLAYYPINDSNQYYKDIFKDANTRTYKIYKDYEHSAFIICKINLQYNVDTKRILLELNSNRNDADNIDGYIPTKGRFLEANSIGYSFEGFYKNELTTGLVFIKKKFIVDDIFETSYSIPSNNENEEAKVIEFGMINYVLMNSRYDLFNKEENKITIENCTFSNPAIGFNYYNNNLVFAILANIDKNINTFKTFIGTKNQLNTNLSSYGNIDYKNGNSLDKDLSIYNSFDSFLECIAIVEIGLNGNNLTKNSVKLHNLIAAPSYIPLFPGLSGQIDLSRCEYYNNTDKTLLPILPLGKSNSSSSFNNLINSVDPDFNIFTTLEDLNKKIESRVYESFTSLDIDKSINIIRNNTLKFTNKYNSWCEWKIDINESIIANHEEFIKVSILNSKSYGRNLYFSGLLSELLVDNENDENSWKVLNYTAEYIDAELSSNQDTSIGVAGTYSIYSNALNKSETNTIYNIEKITACFNRDEKVLKLRFYRHNNDIISMILYGLIQCILLDTADLRVFDYYHLIDLFNVIKDVINISGLDKRYYILGDGTEYYLSSSHLSDYTSLSDIPYLSGFNNASFKFGENSAVPENHEMYYSPGVNDAFPKTFALLYKISTIRNTTDIYKEIGGADNTFVFKLDDKSVISLLGDVEIPIQSYDSDAIRVFEDYLLYDVNGTKPQDTTDTVDINALLYFKLFDNLKISADLTSTISISFLLSDTRITDNPYDFVEEINNLSVLSGLSFLKNETITDTIENPFYYKVNSNSLSSNGDKIDNFLNIYVNYIKDSNGEIELFFNYINYICTPYVKFNGEYLALDYIPGTYLHLKKGESGLLDIIILFKYYKELHLLYGYKNIKIATYKIYNISDDKPKFVIYKNK